MEKKEYWHEALSCALDEIGKFDVLTNEEKMRVAADLEGAADNIGMASPSPSVKPYSESDIRECDLKIKRLERELAEVRLSFKTNVSLRRGWPVDEIIIGDNGHAERL